MAETTTTIDTMTDEEFKTLVKALREINGATASNVVAYIVSTVTVNLLTIGALYGGKKLVRLVRSGKKAQDMNYPNPKG